VAILRFVLVGRLLDPDDIRNSAAILGANFRYLRGFRHARYAQTPKGTSIKAPAKTVLGSGTGGGVEGRAKTTVGNAHSVTIATIVI
jgi:hypothetical protein